MIFALGKSRFQRCIWWNFRLFFQAYVGNFDTIPPWKVVGTLYIDSSYVTFKYFAFLSVGDKFELLVHVQAAMMMWVLFSPFFLDSLLVTISGFIGLFCSSRYFSLLCKFRGLPLLVFPLWDVESVLEWRDRLIQVEQLLGNGLRKHAETPEAGVKRVTPNPGRVCSILNQKR